MICCRVGAGRGGEVGRWLRVGMDVVDGRGR